MTIRGTNVIENNGLHTPDKHFLSVKEQSDNSPPSKKLRLSLKGQKLLGTINNSFEAFHSTQKEKDLTKMQNIRPNMLDPMSLHIPYSGGGLGLITPSYPKMDLNNESDGYEREREKSSQLPPVATLLNLGNTCFLNSVLYTLRFTPGFAHLLHHLATDLANKKLLSTAAIGTSNNERKIGFLSSGSPGLRTKSLSSLTLFNANEENIALQIDPSKKKTLVLTERLHELFQTLHSAEHKGDLSEPFQADAFLQALREVNPLFHGNQQQDAHELLVCFLDYLREACQLVNKAQMKTAVGEQPIGIASCVTDLNSEDNIGVKKGKQNLEKKKKGKKIFNEKSKESKKGKLLTGSNPFLTGVLHGDVVNPSMCVLEEVGHSGTPDFISESFEGVTVLRTTCLECEYVTERKESFMDICVPIISDNQSSQEATSSPSSFFASRLMEVDFLRDANKYWCEQCVRYNEARRSVHYEKLPRLLVLQLKRFSLSFGSTVHASKVNDYMPTPMHLNCFCENCLVSPDSPVHSYKLYAIIMHLGATMASGHYVAYTRVCPSGTEYVSCSQTKPVSLSPSVQNRSNVDRNSGNSSGASGIMRFLKLKSSNTLGTEPVISTIGNGSPFTLCRSVNCCSARPRKLFSDALDREKEREKDRERETSGRDSPASNSSNSSTSNLSEDVWLECDDEVIRILRLRELEDLLSRKPRTSALTPYLLFYVQSASGQGASGMK